MLRYLWCFTLVLLVVSVIGDEKTNTQAPTTAEKPKENAEQTATSTTTTNEAVADTTNKQEVKQETKNENKEEKKQENKEENIQQGSKDNSTNDLTADEKMKGFLKLYNFALKHGKLNLTETLKNLTNLNETIPTSNLTKGMTSNNKGKEAKEAETVKIPAKGAKITKKPGKEAEAGSGEHEGKLKDGKWSKEWTEDEEDNDGSNHGGSDSDGSNSNSNSYTGDYYGGNGQGFEYTNNNGDVKGDGYQYQYDNNPSGGNSEVGTPAGSESMASQPIGMEATGAFPQDNFGSEYAPHGGFGDTHQFENDNPSEYNQQGFVNFDDGASQPVGNGNYDKKKHIHKLKKGNKRHHKSHSNVIHLHTNAHHHHMAREAAKKLVTVKKHLIEGNGYRRTIMIGRGQ